MTTRAQARADAVFGQALDRWLARLTQSNAASAVVHDRIARRLARELRGTSAANIQQAVSDAFSVFERDRVRLIESAITGAAETGSGLTTNVARAVFGDTEARNALVPVVEGTARSVAERRLSREMYGETMRARLRRRTSVLGRNMARQVRESAALSETTQELSQRVLRVRNIEVRLPRYIEEVRAAARGADPSAVRSTVRRHIAALQEGRLADHDISRQTRRFLSQVERSQGADVDRAVDDWVRGRAHNQAMTIARTEGQSALNEAYVAQSSGQPWVVGQRWNISSSHKVVDVCDMMAEQDGFGLGPGGYPNDAVPALAHPNDMCFFTAIIDEHYLERSAPNRDGPEPPRPWETEDGLGGRDWMASQPAERRAQILGPGRAREFDRRPTAVVNSDGSFNPLYRIQGRPPPPLPAGERFEHRRNGEVVLLGAPRRRSRSST